jgi:multiple sugar transport system substrate-binding protein
MKNTLTRRQMLKTSGGALGAAWLLSLTGCGGGGSSDEVQMRMAWWGSTIRHQRTKEALNLFEKRNSGVKIEPEPSGDFAEYWNKMATQASGGNAPDVIQTDYRYLTEYAGRGVLMELDEYIPDPINLKNFNDQQLENGQIEGKTYALSLGDNSPLVVYDVASLEEAGVEPPGNGWTWDDLSTVAGQITEAVGGGFYGTEDAGGQEPVLEVFLIQKGQSLYEDGKLGFDEAAFAEWLTYWDDLRNSGACAPGDVQATDTGDLNTTLLIQGKAAMDFASSNQYTGLSELTDRELDFAVEPGGPEGQYIKPSQLLSGYSRTEYTEEVAQVIDFFLNDKGANKILGTERGVSGNSQIREMLQTEVPKTEQEIFDYIQFVSDNGAPLPPPPPPGAAEVNEIVLRTNEEVAFSKASVDEAVTKFFADANSALDKARQ